jgi:hypothetical protein
MHLQVRFQPRTSPADVEKVLRKVKNAGINLVGIGGSDLEFGGELALVPEHGREQDLMTLLAAYNPRLLDSDDPESGLTLCVVGHHAGGLHDCLASIASSNVATGRIIRDMLIGVPDASQLAAQEVPVQIYSEPVKTSTAPDD